MLGQLALIFCILFILWLFVRDRKLRPMTSNALWIPLLWIIICGTRPISTWFGSGIQIENIDDYLEGSPLDRNTLLILIIVGVLVLFRRRVEWSNLIASNKWVFIFFLYCGISVIWSGYSFVSLKRWIKDIGNLVMVLLIVTDGNSIEALRAVLARFTYIAVTLSFVFMKYLPELGRSYNRWTGEPTFIGIATEKNGLGQIMFICGIFLIWDLIEMKMADKYKKDTLDLMSRFVLMFMTIWSLIMAHSSTSIVCMILGVSILLILRTDIGKRQVRYLGTYSLSAGILLSLLYLVPDILDSVVRIVGRDVTLTGRTELWSDLLKSPINPIIGAGFQSFWQTPFAAHLGEKYYFIPNQAHNGFIEVYLQTGLIGLFLLMAVIISTGRKLKEELLLGGSYGMLCFSFFMVNLFNNWTEATINKLSLVWIILVITFISYKRSTKSVVGNI